MLPQGGLVRADAFQLDADGRVVSGSWSGVIELGPFGEINLLSGQITNAGLAGSFLFSIHPPFGFGSLLVDFRLRSDGLLFGDASGSLDFGGFLTSETQLTLLETGFFAGRTQFQLVSNCLNSRLNPFPPFSEYFLTEIAEPVSQLITLVINIL